MTDNAWRSFDTPDPIYTWTLELELSAPERRFEVLQQLGRAGDESGVFTLRHVTLAALPCSVRDAPDNSAWVEAARASKLDEILPFEENFFAADPPAGEVEVLSTVSFERAGRGVVTERHADAGVLLRELDPQAGRPFIDRFYVEHPFIAPWSTTKGSQLRVELGFWCDLWFNRDSAELAALNGERLEIFRRALDEIAATWKGELRLEPG